MQRLPQGFIRAKLKAALNITTTFSHVFEARVALENHNAKDCGEASYAPKKKGVPYVTAMENNEHQQDAMHSSPRTFLYQHIATETRKRGGKPAMLTALGPTYCSVVFTLTHLQKTITSLWSQDRQAGSKTLWNARILQEKKNDTKHTPLILALAVVVLLLSVRNLFWCGTVL